MLHSNKKVMENYFFMTILQILNSLFYILIYPYLIRTLGADSYGLYVFVLSIVTYFITFINFGFDLPAVKSIAENINNKIEKEKTLSAVFTTKIYLAVIAWIVLVVFVLVIPSIRVNWKLFFICFGQSITNILFPQWYFQGIQRMRTVTFIQLLFKLISLLFIFLYVKNIGDIVIFASIITATSVAGALMAALIIRFREGLVICWSTFYDVKTCIKQAIPFFAVNSMNVIKQQSATVILGSFFSMKDVALYDLAMKIYTVPTILISSINSALFPKIVVRKKLSDVVKKIILAENLISVSIILFLFIFGRQIIHLMGGNELLGAYPLLIILSFSIFVPLTVGAINNFIFIPKNKTNYIMKNQLIAIIFFFLIALVGVSFIKNIYVVPLALTLSGFAELIYVNVTVKKEKLIS
ncbi:MAG: oligosaccharide flippase family protein [Pigmentiphaga sp.]|nr:oligosaccharide flippase family protein [Pigmentiphaga sp.]